MFTRGHCGSNPGKCVTALIKGPDTRLDLELGGRDGPFEPGAGEQEQIPPLKVLVCHCRFVANLPLADVKS